MSVFTATFMSDVLKSNKLQTKLLPIVNIVFKLSRFVFKRIFSIFKYAKAI